MTDPDHWYNNRHALECEQIYRLTDGGVVKLDHGKPGDGTRWVVATWSEGYPAGPSYPACPPGWGYYEDTIEPCDIAERLPDNWKGDAA